MLLLESPHASLSPTAYRALRAGVIVGTTVTETAMGTASASEAGPPTSVEQLLADARAALRRLTPEQAYAEMGAGALLVDIRSDGQRAADGQVPGARVVARNVLEWRLDPACPNRDPELGRANARIVLLCDEGYQSSLAAATVRSFGVSAATDVIGGFRAWRAAGLPVERARADD
jgi:rhodanese-related sulfurtransferase